VHWLIEKPAQLHTGHRWIGHYLEGQE